MRHLLEMSPDESTVPKEAVESLILIFLFFKTCSHRLGRFAQIPEIAQCSIGTTPIDSGFASIHGSSSTRKLVNFFVILFNARCMF